MRRRLIALTMALAAVVMSVGYAQASVPTARISGDGSSAAGNEIMDWVSHLTTQGARVDYNPDGDAMGLTNFAENLVDYAVTSLPYGAASGVTAPSARPFNYAPIGATAIGFMYNLPIGSSRYTNLRLNQATLAGIFSGQITHWNAPQIAATNPGVSLPAQQITVVVRSDGAGATLQLTQWMKQRFPAQYAALCARAGCNAEAPTSYFPTQNMSNFVAQSGSNGVTTYSAGTAFTINYDEYGYALATGFPVASVANASGHYVQPTTANSSLTLARATVSTGGLIDFSAAYTAPDASAYPLLMPFYAIVPSGTAGISAPKGNALVYFLTYAVCGGQASAGSLGYAPITPNLVTDTFGVLHRLASANLGVDASQATLANCKGNPTFRLTSLSRPAIVGTVRSGQTVTATLGSWTPAPTSYSFQWRSNGRAIYRATARSYVIARSLGGTNLSVTVTAHRAGFPSASSTSASRAVPLLQFAQLAAPYLYGTLRVGSTMHVNLGRWNPTPSTVAMTWYDNGFPVATNRTSYYLGSSTAGTQIRVVLWIKRAGYATRRIVLTGAHLVSR